MAIVLHPIITPISVVPLQKHDINRVRRVRRRGAALPSKPVIRLSCQQGLEKGEDDHDRAEDDVSFSLW